MYPTWMLKNTSSSGRSRADDGNLKLIVRASSLVPVLPTTEKEEFTINHHHCDAAVQGILDEHGVSLAACVQTFDAMKVLMRTCLRSQLRARIYG